MTRTKRTTTNPSTEKRAGRPLWAEVDLDAIAHNLSQVRARVGPSRVLAVVKANAYGHGAVPVAGACLEARASYLGVFCVDEGVQLRRAGITAPVLIMGYCPPWEAGEIVRHRLTASLSSRETAQALAGVARAAGTQAVVHLKVDTGMARHGVLPSEVGPMAEFLASLPDLRLEGAFTHFATADEGDKSFTRGQFAAFQQAAESLPAGVFRHVANSAACADLPGMALDMVRPGICLYGCQPSGNLLRPMDLRPALALKSCVARLHLLPEGETVSYGRTWGAKRATRVALIPCGYADGLPRLVSNAGAVLVRGKRAPIIGRVCMDSCMVDVTDIPGVAVHDEAVFIGRQGEEAVTAEEIADLAGTISYEVLCGITARVPRVYLRGGEVFERTTLVSGGVEGVPFADQPVLQQDGPSR